MTIEFFMAMNPPTKTHQEKQITVVKGKPIVYEPAELPKQYALSSWLTLGQHVPKEKFKGPLRFDSSKWCFPLITGKRKDGQWKDTKPG